MFSLCLVWLLVWALVWVRGCLVSFAVCWGFVFVFCFFLFWFLLCLCGFFFALLGGGLGGWLLFLLWLGLVLPVGDVLFCGVLFWGFCTPGLWGRRLWRLHLPLWSLLRCVLVAVYLWGLSSSFLYCLRRGSVGLSGGVLVCVGFFFLLRFGGWVLLAFGLFFFCCGLFIQFASVYFGLVVFWVGQFSFSCLWGCLFASFSFFVRVVWWLLVSVGLCFVRGSFGVSVLFALSLVLYWFFGVVVWCCFACLVVLFRWVVFSFFFFRCFF